MKPIFKYSGGKSRELKTIKSLLPKEFKRIVEPFSGSAAVSFGLEIPAILSDLRENNIKTFEAVRDNYNDVSQYIEDLKSKNVEFLEKEY